MAKVYKIRSKKTGLFSTGGSSPRWSKKGKIWAGSGPLNNHLNVIKEYGGYGKIVYDREEAELVEYELIEQEISSTALAEHIKGVEDRIQQREDQRNKWQEENEKKQRRKQFESLKKEFDN
jgi:hypothetical protein